MSKCSESKCSESKCSTSYCCSDKRFWTFVHLIAFSLIGVTMVLNNRSVVIVRGQYETMRQEATEMVLALDEHMTHQRYLQMLELRNSAQDETIIDLHGQIQGCVRALQRLYMRQESGEPPKIKAPQPPNREA